MDLFHAFLLSLLQGATEFLPVSSSGHEVLARALLEGEANKEDPILFVLLVHIGTLIAITCVFRNRLIELIRYALRDAWQPTAGESLFTKWQKDNQSRLIMAILVATVPTGIIGLLGKDAVESLFSRPDLSGFALCVTALLLFSTRFRPQESQEEPPFITYWQAFLVGVAQGFALVPGISRSGSTIAVALLLGMGRRQAGEFSFLIAIPATLAALALKARDFEASDDISWFIGFVSLVVSAVSGYFFLKLLLRFVRGGQFIHFGWYCLAVGIGAILYF